MSKLLLCLAVLLCLAFSAVAAPNAAQAFNSYKSLLNKQYDDPSEEVRRFQIFQNNMILADQWNRELNTDAFGIESPFADMTQEEFAETYLMNPEVLTSLLTEQEGMEVEPYTPAGIMLPPAGVPTFDWSTKLANSVTPVKNQAQCGSCWAFAATEVLESRWVINGNAQVILSPQQLVDCTYPGQDGCNGGWYGAAWNYIKGTGSGQAKEASYPYKAVYSGSCKFASSMGTVPVTAVESISNEASLYTYITSTAPAAVAVDAGKWYLYKGQNTVFPASNCTGAINHAVVVTGYTNINGVDVWKIRNSWGTSWGNSGYIYLPMNKNACQVGNYAQGVQTTKGNPPPPPAPSKSPLAPSKSAAPANDYVTVCLNTINQFRARVGSPALSLNSAQTQCANNQAKIDYTNNRAHSAFGQCSEYGQNECPGWGSTSQITSCLQMMFDEGPPPAGSFNHYSIMTNKDYRSVACGYYDNGAGKVWMLQDFYYS